MSWTVEYAPEAARAMRDIDQHISRRIFDGVEWLAMLDDPTTSCKALSGDFAGLWRLRVGDYRAILDLWDGKVIVMSLELGSRVQI